ncbi:RNA polymerase II subunit A C-terminal domain phosphatase-like [Watersipora subatra]|uniref:RNA polymerase II subunit A C-terminal domain phosphatase-like n=1 Tax=Watersipora subatra TaxID=2589382 RepID=UPI00355C262B
MSAAAVKALYSPAGASIEIVKWKVRKGSQVDPGSVLMTYKIKGRTEIMKLKSEQIGGVVELLRKEGDTVLPRQQLLRLAGCNHNIVIKDLCAECGKDLREERKEVVRTDAEVESNAHSNKARVSMVHSIPELVVTDKHAVEIGKTDIIRLRRSKKLVLLVDLDQTLIHTTTDNIPNKLKGVHHFRMGRVWYHTMFRPGTERFLLAISKLYELHIVTFGVREYAHTVVKIMDKEGKYFSHRILSRDELLDGNTKKANLKSLFPCGDDMVAIIDDREDVWNYSENVIPVLPYKFFTGTGDINAPNKPLGAPLPPSQSTQATSAEGSIPVKAVDAEPNKPVQGVVSGQTPVNDVLNAPSHSSKRMADEIESPLCKKQKCIIRSDDVESKECNKPEPPNLSEDISKTEDQPETKPESSSSDGDKEDDEVKVESCKKTLSDNEGSEDANTSEKNSKKKTGSDDRNQESTSEDVVGESREGKKGLSGAKGAKTEEVEQEVEWPDDDDYLERLTEILVEVHACFYKEENGMGTEGRKVSSVLSDHCKQVLEGCVLAFSGLFPQSQSLFHSTAYAIATKLGAKVTVNVEDNVTHLVASRLGTKKVRQAAGNENCTIVHPDWLWLSWYKMKRENELLHILSKDNEIPEPKSNNFSVMCGKYDPSFGRKRKLPAAVDEEEIRRAQMTDVDIDYQPGCNDDTVIFEDDEQLEDTDEKLPRRFSDTVNPMMAFDQEDLRDMDAEVDDAFGDTSSSESDNESRDIELRKKVLSSDEHDSDSEESLSNDYPKGWGPRVKSRSPHDLYDELAEEDYLHLQEAAENSPMEINSSDEEDNLMAAQIDKAFQDV